MPEQVWIRSTFMVIPAFPARFPSQPFRLRVAGAEGRSSVQVEIAISGGSATGQAVRELPDGFIQRIMADQEFNRAKFGKPLLDHVRDVSDAVLRVLDLIAQELDHREGYRVANHEGVWSYDGEVWHPFPEGERLYTSWSRSIPNLNDDTLGHIQELLDLGEDALTASEHLREAYRAYDERFGWIEATIAAELAIKQVLVRMEPKLGIVLFDLPSPPLHMLYGSVLEQVAGVKSPYAGRMGELARKRNQLVHRPRMEAPDAKEFREAVGMVHDAIRHLLKLDRDRARTMMAGGVQ